LDRKSRADIFDGGGHSVLTGFNTDVRFEGQTYHVQSEDRGRAHPVLESLVYCGGQILHQERSSYESRLEAANLEAAVAALLDRQHRDIVRRARHGEFALVAGHATGIAAGAAGAAPAAEQGPLIDQLSSLLATDEEVEPLELTFARDDEAPSMRGILSVRRAEDGAAVPGTRVTGRLVGLGLAPMTVLTAETDDTGTTPVLLVLPPTATAVIFAAERGPGGGRLRIPVSPGVPLVAPELEVTLSHVSGPRLASPARGSSS